MSGRSKEETQGVMVGALIGLALGVSGMLIYNACHKEGGIKGKIEEALGHLGEFVKKHAGEEGECVLHDIQKRLAKNKCTLVDVLKWGATGFQLWKEWKENCK